jgi:starch synthase
MRVLFATAEYAPLVKVGGLADASAGLAGALRAMGVEVDVILPDYAGDRARGTSERLHVPAWVGTAWASTRSEVGAGDVTWISNESLTRPHPYVDDRGLGWPDNDFRFMAFSAAVASLAALRRPDILHLNDWHTAAALGLLREPIPSVLTVHNPAYQGTTSARWLSFIRRRPEAYEWYGDTNPLTGGIALSDAVVTVSPTFAAELLRPETSFGLQGPLRAKGDAFKGILNGIDTDVWNPAEDPHLPVRYGIETASRKRELGRRLAAEMGYTEGAGPLVGMVTRLTGQKGVDLALAATPLLEAADARMVLLGAGEAGLAAAAREIADSGGDRFAFYHGYDEGLAHRIFGACDLVLVPSRFEPCGLTQMQAMRYGAAPVVTDVGGLHDTVVDADAHPDDGTGFVALRPDGASVVDATSRAIRAWRNTRRRGEIRRRAMSRDWSWALPSRQYLSLYQGLISPR